MTTKKNVEPFKRNINGGFKPFSDEGLDKQKEEIYKEQFNEENEFYYRTSGAEKVLDSLQRITTNPGLFDYLLKCLSKQGIHLKSTYLAVVIEKPIYDNRPDSELAFLRMKDDDPKYVLKITLPLIFKTVLEVEEFINDKSYFTDERIDFDNKAAMQGLKLSDLLFEKYTIKELGVLTV